MGWQKGESGNPGGRPRGRGKCAEVRKLLADHRGELVQKAVELAMSGDVTALKLCLDRCLPPLKPSAEPITVKGADTLAGQAAAIMHAVTAGTVPPDVGALLMRTLMDKAKIHEIDELEQRLTALEQGHAQN